MADQYELQQKWNKEADRLIELARKQEEYDRELSERNYERAHTLRECAADLSAMTY